MLPPQKLVMPGEWLVLPYEKFELPGEWLVLPYEKFELPGEWLVLPYEKFELPGEWLAIPGEGYCVFHCKNWSFFLFTTHLRSGMILNIEGFCLILSQITWEREGGKDGITIERNHPRSGFWGNMD
ncbi:MAG: hypothetical protein ACM3SY_03625 [Candidatus Omnitrophota bacterium]